MRWRLLFFVSLGVNIAVGVIWYVSARREAVLRAASVGEPQPATVIVKTNPIIRRQFFSWAEVESDDYPTYIANLRDISCPEQTIRDIIIADVNALYARRLAMEVVTPSQQWWRSEPDPEVVQAAAEKTRALDEERRALLAGLLGTNWESGDLASLPRPSHRGVALDGAVLGALPAETKQAVQDASIRAENRFQAYLDELRQQGRDPDPGELARLEQQARHELARILTPPQLEEFLLRYSRYASGLRAELGELKYFDATPDEFRAVFRATDAIEQRIQLLAGADDPNSVAQRNALVQQRENYIRIALGPDRYLEYQLLHDPVYRDAVAAAERAGDPDAVDAIYEINLATAQRLAAIRANTNLTAAQRAIELKRAELEQLKANAQATGQELPPEPAPPPLPSVRQPAFVAPTRPYVLGVGETVSSVSMQYGISMDALRAANPGLNLSRLRPGDSFRVPGPGLVPSEITPAPPAPGGP